MALFPMTVIPPSRNIPSDWRDVQRKPLHSSHPRSAKQRLALDVTRLDGMLREDGMTVIGGTRLFRLAQCAEASSLYQRLGEAGILVRSFDYRPDWLRFGIPGGAEEWRRLADALGISAAT